MPTLIARYTIILFITVCQLPCFVLPLSFRKPKLGMITSFHVNLIENAAKKCSKRQFAFVLGRVKDFLSHMEVGRGGYGNKGGYTAI